MKLEEATEFLKKKVTVNNAVIKEARKNGDLNTIELTNDLDTESKAIETVLQALERYQRLAEANLKDAEEFENNMCNHRCLLKLELDNSISKDKVKEKLNKVKGRITYLREEINKTLNEATGTETEIDINEQYICNMEIELEKLETTQKVLEELLEDK